MVRSRRSVLRLFMAILVGEASYVSRMVRPKHFILLNLYKTPCNQDSAFVMFNGYVK